MPKNYKQNAEERSVFFSPVIVNGDNNIRGERGNTSPLRGARLIDVKRIKPDPNQPRKKFTKEKLESLAESISELGEIIDPLTVEYVEKEDFFRIISGERRYRAARIAGLNRLPCIIKEVDEKRRLLFQLIANLQREDITPLEESLGIRSLMERFGYSQTRVAKLMNKSESYISQILGLERLSKPAREILQTSEVSKEVQIRASREKEPSKQQEILKKASEEGKTVKQIRAEGQIPVSDNAAKLDDGLGSECRLDKATLKTHKFRKWSWMPKDRRFEVTIQFSKEQSERKRNEVVKAALGQAYKCIRDLIHRQR
jgi:ParB family chromosome partitioning protein